MDFVTEATRGDEVVRRAFEIPKGLRALRALVMTHKSNPYKKAHSVFQWKWKKKKRSRRLQKKRRKVLHGFWKITSTSPCDAPSVFCGRNNNI